LNKLANLVVWQASSKIGNMTHARPCLLDFTATNHGSLWSQPAIANGNQQIVELVLHQRSEATIIVKRAQCMRFHTVEGGCKSWAKSSCPSLKHWSWSTGCALLEEFSERFAEQVSEHDDAPRAGSSSPASKKRSLLLSRQSTGQGIWCLLID